MKGTKHIPRIPCGLSSEPVLFMFFGDMFCPLCKTINPGYNENADGGDEFMQTGQIIAKQRTQMGLSQVQLADSLFVSRDLVSKWETGKRFPEYKLVLEMAELFCVDPDLLIEDRGRFFVFSPLSLRGSGASRRRPLRTNRKVVLHR